VFRHRPAAPPFPQAALRFLALWSCSGLLLADEQTVRSEVSIKGASASTDVTDCLTYVSSQVRWLPNIRKHCRDALAGISPANRYSIFRWCGTGLLSARRISEDLRSSECAKSREAVECRRRPSLSSFMAIRDPPRTSVNLNQRTKNIRLNVHLVLLFSQVDSLCEQDETAS
jgi:hypothetical protein